MTKLERFGRELYEDGINLDTPRLKEVISGDISLGKAAKSFAASKAREMIDKYTKKAKYRNPVSRKFLMPFDPRYHFVKETVKRAFVGRAYDIREASAAELGGNLGEHRNGKIKVLDDYGIPKKIFGMTYGEILGKLKENGEKIIENTKDYIKLHEISEMEYMKKYGINRLSDDEHGRVEAYLLRALDALPKEGYYTKDIHEAAVAVHSMRKSNDKFLKNTMKYYPILGKLIAR